jgi:aminoglycoside phosphotransferase (APT) family kinase protein
MNQRLPHSSDLKGYDIQSVERLGEGLDHIAHLINGDIVVRQAKEPDPGAVQREAAVLRIVGEHTELPVPSVLFADPDEGLLAHRFLPGLPLIDMAEADHTGIGLQLGRFLSSLHGIPLVEVEEILPREEEPLQEWLDEARESFSVIADHLGPAACSRIEAFLAAPPPADPDRLAFCHNDFGAEHILVDPDTMRVTGIIDWADAAIADPVRDLALILRDLGPGALDAALEAYGRRLTPDDRRRLVFHARCKLIEDLAYGLETASNRYIDAALAHLDWTFGTA